MEIKKKYLSKYLHDIAVDQIAEEYIKSGYVVKKDEKLGNYEADIIARNNNEQIVIEVKTGIMSPDKKRKISDLADHVNQLKGYRFKVVIATPPREKGLEIEEIHSLLSNYVLNNPPDELDVLSDHSMIDEIIEIDIDQIKISGSSIFVKGNGIVSVELQIASDDYQDKKDESRSLDNFPFDFEIMLGYNSKKELVITAVDKLKIDTSYYYD